MKHWFVISLSGLSPWVLATWQAPPAFQSCVDYHCDVVNSIQLTADQWAAVRELFETHVSAPIERQQIRYAIALLEQFVGQQTGTWQDKPRNRGDSSEPGQLDCIAESINTTTYLKLLAQDGLLVWHQVLERKQRNPWFFSVHWTAVIEDRSDHQQYAVDSWLFENGKPPVIQTLEDWLDKKPFEQ
jgi:hypothetical protein